MDPGDSQGIEINKESHGAFVVMETLICTWRFDASPEKPQKEQFLISTNGESSDTMEMFRCHFQWGPIIGLREHEKKILPQLGGNMDLDVIVIWYSSSFFFFLVNNVRVWMRPKEML